MNDTLKTGKSLGLQKKLSPLQFEIKVGIQAGCSKLFAGKDSGSS